MLSTIGPYIVSALFRSLAFLPLWCLQRIGVFCGWVTWCLPGSYKRRAAENLKQAFPDSDDRLLRAAMLSVGTLFLEMPYWWVRRDDAALNKHITCDNWQQFDVAREAQGAAIPPCRFLAEFEKRMDGAHGII